MMSERRYDAALLFSRDHAREAAQAAHRQRVTEFARALAKSDRPLRLRKKTTNLFRPRPDRNGIKAIPGDILRHVLWVDREDLSFAAEPMIRYDDLVNTVLPAGLMPAVVPELRSITIGGAIAGLGIESSSFRFGLVHHTVSAMDIVLADGSLVHATRTNEYADLFWCIPNSFGTLGYIACVHAQASPTLPYVRLRHVVCADMRESLSTLEALMQDPSIHFLEGVVFHPRKAVITAASFVAAAPYTSDYTFEQIYYKSLLQRTEDYVTAAQYIWRWDTDWFWCSRLFGLENPFLRKLFGRQRLNSVTYMRLLQLRRRLPDLAWLRRAFAVEYEPLIHDIPIPYERALEFCDWYCKEINMFPVWLCPLRVPVDDCTVLYPLVPGAVYINFGFWGPRNLGRSPNRWILNRSVTLKSLELGGLPSLYGRVFLSYEELRAYYNLEEYEKIKRKYDPQNRLRSLPEKLGVIKER